MALPWYAWAGIGIGSLALVAIVASAVSKPAPQQTFGTSFTPSNPAQSVSTETAVAQGLTGLATTALGGVFAKIGRDDAARESALVRADRLHRDEAAGDKDHMTGTEEWS